MTKTYILKSFPLGESVSDFFLIRNGPDRSVSTSLNPNPVRRLNECGDKRQRFYWFSGRGIHSHRLPRQLPRHQTCKNHECRAPSFESQEAHIFRCLLGEESVNLLKPLYTNERGKSWCLPLCPLGFNFSQHGPTTRHSRASL